MKSKKEKLQIEYYFYCPLCDKEIKSPSPDKVIYSLEAHLNTCKKKKKGGQNEKTNNIRHTKRRRRNNK